MCTLTWRRDNQYPGNGDELVYLLFWVQPMATSSWYSNSPGINRLIANNQFCTYCLVSANPSLSKSSSSSSSGVLVPSVGDKDIDWDNDLDLDEDISEEEMKKIMESLGNSDLGKLGDLEVDVSEKLNQFELHIWQ